MNRREKILDWAYDPHTPLLNIPAVCIRVITGIWFCMGDLARQQKVKDRIG